MPEFRVQGTLRKLQEWTTETEDPTYYREAKREARRITLRIKKGSSHAEAHVEDCDDTEATTMAADFRTILESLGERIRTREKGFDSRNGTGGTEFDERNKKHRSEWHWREERELMQQNFNEGGRKHDVKKRKTRRRKQFPNYCQ